MATISKAEYLKRYMSDAASDEPTEKKKKKRKVNKTAPHLARSRIVDDDVDFKTLLPSNLENTLEEDVGDNDPTVVAIIDERPEYIKRLEAYREDERWKLIAKSEESTGNLADKKGRNDSDSDQSPARKGRHDSDSDQSPLRKGRHDSDSDQSPLRKQRHDSDSDQSPVRKQRHDSDSDQSPVRKQRHDSNSDQSPPRKSKSQSDKDHKSVKSKTQKHNSDSDFSPPRKSKNVKSNGLKHNDSKSKLSNSVPRKSRFSDITPPRKRKHSSDSDQSPPRRGQGSDSDQSPPRKGNRSSSDQSHSRRGRGSDSDLSPPRKGKPVSVDSKEDKMKKTLSGKKAGLSSARDMKEEARKLKLKEEESFRKIGDDNLGKNAATVFRDKSGKRRNLKEEREKTEEELAREEEKQAKYREWGKGLKQKESQEQTLTDHLHEMSKPLARYKDDEDLDKMLRDQDRAEDPMLAFIKKKSKVKDAKVKEKPRYKGPMPPPNRFNIMPGYRWDGVDRSNGFEKALFSKISDKKATDHQAFKWSVEDM